MKKLLLIGVLFLLVANIAPGQVNAIAVQKDGNVTFYSKLNDAIENAPAGADVIIPGGTWNNWNGNWNYTIIAKEIHIYGAGYEHSSTGATASTKIVPERLYFTTGSSNSSISGIEFEQVEIFGVIDNFQMHRCQGGVIIRQDAIVTNFKCTESHLSYLNGGDVHGSIFEKNIITNILGLGPSDYHPNYWWDGEGNGSRKVDYAIFNHNIFICAPDFVMMNNVKNSTFSNNIIIHEKTDPYTGYNNFFQNNIMTGTFTLPDDNGNLGMNNIMNVAPTDIFINWITPVPGGWRDTRDLSSDIDLHLKPGGPGHDAATDGTDIGLYGTSVPYKDGAIPILPHYLECNIPAQLDANGKLNISVTVEAQTK